MHTLIRNVVAHAKLHLRKVVTKEDAEAAIDLFDYVRRTVMVDEDGSPDVLTIEVGKSSKTLSKTERLLELLRKMEKGFEDGVPEEELFEVAQQKNVATTRKEFNELIAILLKEGHVRSVGYGKYRSSFGENKTW